MKTACSASRLFLVILFAVVCVLPLPAQNGKLKIKVKPPQAYVFVDGSAMSQAGHALTLSPGEHKIGLYNYGYKPVTQTVTISPNATANLDVTLEAIPDKVTGPWGAVTIEGASRDAVLVNGKAPENFVGHGDEFNNEWLWKQELVLPPGTHQITVVREGRELWSGPVEVKPNERVVLDIPKGVRKTVAWSRGQQLGSVGRFKTGTASALVAVAKPTAQFSTQSATVDCGQSTPLKWSTSDAAQVEIAGVGPVAASGEQPVDPKQTTTYELRATGPGGTATSSATVNVNNTIQAQLALAPAELRYKKVGDKVVESPSTALNWSVSNANAVSIEPLGSVDATGTRSLQITPKRTELGPVDETVVYTLKATNPCGGTETRSASLHLVGSIEPEPVVAMQSIYFPTNLPRAHRKPTGLVTSQQDELLKIVDAFKQVLAARSDARLMLSGHADQRGSTAYNQALSERRAELAKAFLVEHGIPIDNVQTEAFGETHNLTRDEVKQLVEQNPDLTDAARKKALRNLTTLVLAHNRRVDVAVSGGGQQPILHYPFKAADAAQLMRLGGTGKAKPAAPVAGR